MEFEKPQKILIYIVRRELRLTDNPILHHISSQLSKTQVQIPYTHLLPIYVFPARQIEICGFLSPDHANLLNLNASNEHNKHNDSGNHIKTSKSPSATESPYPPARSLVGSFPRCGPHRAKFWAESVWDFKTSLESVGSGLVLRVGRIDDILEHVLNSFTQASKKGDMKYQVVGVWITAEEGVAEKTDERNVFRVAGAKGVPVKVWKDEKFLIDDRDLPYVTPKDIPDSYSDFKKAVSHPREAPRKTLPRPDILPPLPTFIPPQPAPFTVPDRLEDWISHLIKPLKDDPILVATSTPPSSANADKLKFHGGEAYALQHLEGLISSGRISPCNYNSSGEIHINLAAWLALGCITARQIHEYLKHFEDGTTSLGRYALGYQQGPNKRTAAVREELLWRDYLRLCTRKYGSKLFRLEGFKGDSTRLWKHADDPEVRKLVVSFMEGNTGDKVVDGVLREMYWTGHIAEKERWIAARYFGRELGIDWRIGAEWFEYCLVDYDVSGNWGGWQYCVGVGIDANIK
ncbi:hypothetical protein TWF694_003148 [Orbilia ellipsospora]|uniref:Photolyase/cryptochrome alpha/beta domain-containing protein n=1 Tax=Orbilia ellipsospora TaxID=2528407 RepID=A0AAV9X0R2_9PEZI